MSAGSADLSVFSGRFGSKLHANLVIRIRMIRKMNEENISYFSQSMPMRATTTKNRMTMPIMTKPRKIPSVSVLSQ